MDDITELLRRVEAGQADAHDRLMSLVYVELKRIARGVRARHHGAINTTALVHESYLRLIGNSSLSWPDRNRYFGCAARIMRNILVDQARQEGAVRHGGDLRRIEFTDAVESAAAPAVSLDLIDLDRALARLEVIDPDLARLVDLHVFAGLEFTDVAQCLDMSERSVFRAWQKAKALLHGLLAGG